MVEAGKLFQEEVNKGYFEDGFTGVSREEAQLQICKWTDSDVLQRMLGNLQSG